MTLWKAECKYLVEICSIRTSVQTWCHHLGWHQGVLPKVPPSETGWAISYWWHTGHQSSYKSNIIFPGSLCYQVKLQICTCPCNYITWYMCIYWNIYLINENVISWPFRACLVLGCLFLVSAVSIVIKSTLALKDHVLPETVSWIDIYIYNKWNNFSHQKIYLVFIFHWDNKIRKIFEENAATHTANAFPHRISYEDI